MNKENANAAEGKELTVRITRAHAKALRASRKVVPSKPSFKQDTKRVLRSHIKRAALDENKPSVTTFACLQHKRRAVLRDVTNISCESSNAKDAAYLNCNDTNKVQHTKQAGKCPAKHVDETTDILMEVSPIEEDDKARLIEELSKIRMGEEPEITSPERLRKGKTKCHAARKRGVADQMLPRHDSIENTRLQRLENQGEKEICGTLETSSSLGIANIDLNKKDPQFCSLYVTDIYANVHVAELDQRPSINYMERLQHDITPSMRGILIDWLVEVSEEYKLVPDTLYLTVNLIDRFLSQNEIEKHRLQLLGVACMLIASKYEEFCAPRVEEFCFITDNTYTRGEVLKMESQVLSLLHFQLSVPTIKTFLRRFIQAAQAAHQVPCVELEFLANYLAELTLVDYNFLKFLPSLVAASSVFLARWTLNQSVHPWNPTLEHYTRYKASELKCTVLALEDLQLNTNVCSLNAIREKYGQQKFKCVANMTSPKRAILLF